MRFKKKENQMRAGLVRICEGFLFFPLKIEGETRWLEKARWLEYSEEIGDFGDNAYSWYLDSWIDTDRHRDILDEYMKRIDNNGAPPENVLYYKRCGFFRNLWNFLIYM